LDAHESSYLNFGLMRICKQYQTSREFFVSHCKARAIT